MHRLPSRPRPPSSRAGAFFFSAAVLVLPFATPAPAEAQIPPLPDDIVQDTLPQDTVPGDTAVPPPQLPPIGPVGPTGWANGAWEWDRAALVRLPDLSLLQLMERVPGITPVRTAHAVHAEGAAVLGSAARAVRYIVDGFELDPLVGPSIDPARIPLLALRLVRVERGITGAVVRIETLTPTEAHVRSVVEAGTGDFGTNLFRGIFLAPRVLGGSLGLGFERLAADRPAGGSGNHTGAWLKWSFVRDSAGVQLEYRRSEMIRSGVDGAGESLRHDWTARARTRLLGLTAEAFVGASSTEDDRGTLTLREGTPQGGLRLGAGRGGALPWEARATLRLRDHRALPGQELELEARAAPLPWIGIGATATERRWRDGARGGSATGRVVVGPFLGISAFAELERGRGLLGAEPGVRVFDATDALAFALDRRGARLGAELGLLGARVGAALLRTTADSVAGFGHAFDPEAPRFGAGTAQGLEVVASLPTGIRPLRIEAWWTGMDVPSTWIYLPTHQWTGALAYHHLPLPSGNLEIEGRVEHRYRGPMRVPLADAIADVAAYRSTDLELSIRVLDVTAFVRWDNILHRQLQRDLPDSRLPGQHVLYGVKWAFWN